jgi:hypothetical protein
LECSKEPYIAYQAVGATEGAAWATEGQGAD